MICYDEKMKKMAIKSKFLLKNFMDMSEKFINATQALAKINSNYENLSLIVDKDIAVRRMKPLFSRPSDKKFIINGHYKFMKGASDNPDIGTTEDWHFINNLVQAHPFHFHLVNFQVIQKYSLKLTAEGCTYYQLDFYRISNYPPFKNMSNAQACNYLNHFITSDEAEALYDYLSIYYL